MRPTHILVLLIVLIILFGARRLPDVARSIGQSLKVLKKEVSELQDDLPLAAPSTAVPATAPAPEPAALATPADPPRPAPAPVEP